jgi:hypothetical protein
MFAGLAHGASRAPPGRGGGGTAPRRRWREGGPCNPAWLGPAGSPAPSDAPLNFKLPARDGPLRVSGQLATERAAGPAPRPGPSLAGGTPSRPWPGDGQEAPRGEARQSRPSGGAAIRNQGLRWRSFGAGTGTAEVDPGKSQPLTVTKDSESPGHLRRPTLPRSLVLIGIQVCRRWVRPKSCSYWQLCAIA